MSRKTRKQVRALRKDIAAMRVLAEELSEVILGALFRARVRDAQIAYKLRAREKFIFELDDDPKNLH